MKVRIGSEVVATEWIHPLSRWSSLVKPTTRGVINEVYYTLRKERFFLPLRKRVVMLEVAWEFSKEEREEWKRKEGIEVTAQVLLSRTLGIRVTKY